ncbi:Rad51-like protein, partial [Dunaliella salina]
KVAQAEEADLEVDDDYLPIEKLQTVGINTGDIKKAKEAGYHTIMSFVLHPSKMLLNIKGLSEAKVTKMVEACKQMTPGSGWRCASEVQAERARSILKITTGSRALDELLGGGLETKSITEIYGEFRCGKTQVRTGNLVQQNVAYIDTEGTFRPDRIIPIAQRFNLDADSVLGNIVHARAFNFEHQMELLISVAALMAEDPFKLLVVDSLTSNFRSDFCGRGELAERQQKLGQMLNRLRKISEEFNVAVVVTNQVVSDPGGGVTFVSDPKKPVGGHVQRL